MNKTPVTILQELMVKNNRSPTYEVLPSSENVFSHNPTFYCRAHADGVSAIGKARTKKEAKHEAARLVLELLSERGLTNALPIKPATPVPTPPQELGSPQKVDINAVGEIKDFCAEKKIPAPTFQLISDIGPAHLRLFTMECTVGSITVTAADLTKKKAKQNVALKMLQRLREALPEDIEEMMVTDSKYAEVISQYEKITQLSGSSMNWGLKIAAYPKTIVNLMEEKGISKQDLREILEENNWLDEVKEVLEINLVMDCFDTEKYRMVVTTIDTIPQFSFAAKADNKTDAEHDTLRQLQAHLKLMSG